MEDPSTWRKQDGKLSRGEANVAKSWAVAAGMMIIAPVSLALLYPTAILYHSVQSLVRIAKGERVIQSRPWPPSVALEPVDLSKEIIPFEKRNLDLVLYGVTGFTGRLAALYLARQYKDKNIRWAIAGRRLEALNNIRKELIAIDASLESRLELIVANSDNPASLDAMVKDTRVVITTAGPFRLYGTGLVKACVERGTSYCDITGESDWCKVLIDKYDSIARERGARIVNMCGHDCVPWDLSVMKCAEAIRKNDPSESLASVECYDVLKGTPSGGTLATMFESIPPPVYKSSTGFDPNVMAADGSKSVFKTINNVQLMPGYSGNVSKFTSFFVMSQVMFKCVQRSNALNGYGESVVYRESEACPNLPSMLSRYLELIPIGGVLGLPPLHERILPPPGDGPSPEAQKEGFLEVTTFAKGTKGSVFKSVIYFPIDPGYADTGRMLVESGLSIALSPEKMLSKGGVLTPASCQGSVLLDRLCETGTKFDVTSKL